MRDYIEKVKAMLDSAGIYKNKVSVVFEDSVKYKEELNKTLGLNEANHFRKELALAMSDEDFNNMYPDARAIFKGIPGWTGDWSPTSGKITVGKDKVNITKFLAKQLADKMITAEYVGYLYNLLKIDKANPKAESQIVPKFGELINKKTNNMVIVSTNPFDFFTSSAGEFKYASFKSCFRPNGEYFNGCISLARDTFSTISFKASTERPDYKQGRAWMFVLDDIVAQTKSYGTFTNNERKVAREFVEHCLSAKFNFDPKTYKKHFVEKWRGAENGKCLYFDDYSIDLGYPAAKHATFTDKMVPKLRFSDALCLKCGRETQYPQKGICGVCSGNYYACKCCNKEILDGSYHTIAGGKVCTACADVNYQKCPDCGNYHEKGAEVAVSATRSVCKACFTSKYYLCDSCGENHKKTAVARVSVVDLGETWCSKCFEAKGFVCPDCKGNYSNKDIHEVNTHDHGIVKVCSSCVTSYSTCMACNKAFKGGYTTKDGDICVVCYENYDYCVHCDSLLLKEDMVFDGEKICCRGCATEAPATNDSYIAEVGSIITAVTEFKEANKDTVMEALRKLTEDRKANGYKDGDIVRVTGDTSWHGFEVGSVITICKVVINKDNEPVYLTFKDGAEWYLKIADLEFARPAIIPGETFVFAGNDVEVKAININAEGNIIYGTDKGQISSCSKITYSGILDTKAFTAPIVNYKVGELLVIVANSSHHPYKEGDKVKVTRVDKNFGMTRFFVKKGTKLGCIYGVDTDAKKAPKAPPSAKEVAASKVADYKAKTKKAKALDMDF